MRYARIGVRWEVAVLQNGKSFFRLLAVGVLVMWGTMSVAQDDDYDDNDARLVSGNNRTIGPAEVKFRQECASCHIAYPPSMLPTESWRNIMAGLDIHFGWDASLSDPEIKEITAFLVDNSAEGWGGEITPSRITKTYWFLRKHNSYVIPSDIRKSRVVKSLANCSACHTHAERGDFSKRNLILPE